MSVRQLALSFTCSRNTQCGSIPEIRTQVSGTRVIHTARDKRHETTLGREKRIALVDQDSRSPDLTQRMLQGSAAAAGRRFPANRPEALILLDSFG
jgi:hypothetical protein